MGMFDFVKKGLRKGTRKKKVVEDEEVVEKAIIPQATTLAPPIMYAQPQAQPQQPSGVMFHESSLTSGMQSDNQFEGALDGQTLGNRNILVLTPYTNQDVTNIVQNLTNGEACVINLEPIPVADAQRRLDFLSGVICAIGGTIKPLDQNKYILTPQGLGVKRVAAQPQRQPQQQQPLPVPPQGMPQGFENPNTFFGSNHASAALYGTNTQQQYQPYGNPARPV